MERRGCSIAPPPPRTLSVTESTKEPGWLMVYSISVQPPPRYDGRRLCAWLPRARGVSVTTKLSVGRF